MGDMNVIIKDGHIFGVDGEDGDDSEVDAISGSGQADVESKTSTTPEFPPLTPTSNSTFKKVSSPRDDNLLPYIIAAVAGVILIIVIITLIVCCRRRRKLQKLKSKKPTPGPVVYSPNGRVGGEGYCVAIPLTSDEGEPPIEDAPPPPIPSSMPPNVGASGSSSTHRYTPLGGRKPVQVSVTLEPEEKKNSIYETIDDEMVANVYEEAKAVVPNSNSGRHHVLSSVGEDPNMGSEKDKMLPPSSPK